MAEEWKRFDGPRLATHVSASPLITKVLAAHKDARQNVMSGAIAIGARYPSTTGETPRHDGARHTLPKKKE
jgi:hypothetical protein